jgi:hypothetical protein
LVSRILVLELIKIILAPPDNIVGIIAAVSGISLHAIVADTHQVWGGIRAVALVLRHVVAALFVLVPSIIPRPIVGVVCWVLLTVNKSYSIDIVIILMIIVFVSPHYELFLRPL